MSSKARSDVADGIFFILLGIGALYRAFDFHIPGNMALSPSIFPVIVSAVIIALGAGQIYKTRTAATTPDAEGKNKVDVKAVASVFLLCVLYVVAMPYIGFLLSTMLYLFLFLLLLREKSRLMICLVPIVTSLAVYLLFSKGLSVMLPAAKIGGF